MSLAKKVALASVLGMLASGCGESKKSDAAPGATKATGSGGSGSASETGSSPPPAQSPYPPVGSKSGATTPGPAGADGRKALLCEQNSTAPDHLRLQACIDDALAQPATISGVDLPRGSVWKLSKRLVIMRAVGVATDAPAPPAGQSVLPSFTLRTEPPAEGWKNDGSDSCGDLDDVTGGQERPVGCATVKASVQLGPEAPDQVHQTDYGWGLVIVLPDHRANAAFPEYDARSDWPDLPSVRNDNGDAAKRSSHRGVSLRMLKDLGAAGTPYEINEWTANVTIDHLILDGAHEERFAFDASRECRHCPITRVKGGEVADGFASKPGSSDGILLRMHAVAAPVVTNSLFKNALYSSAVRFSEVDGGVFRFNVIRKSGRRSNEEYLSPIQKTFLANGFHGLIRMTDTQVEDNLILDSTEIGIGLDARYLRGSTFRRNRIFQVTTRATYAFMIEGDGVDSDATDVVVEGNLINCGGQTLKDLAAAERLAPASDPGGYKCDGGIVLGQHSYGGAEFDQDDAATTHDERKIKQYSFNGCRTQKCVDATKPDAPYPNSPYKGAADWGALTRIVANVIYNSAQGIAVDGGNRILIRMLDGDPLSNKVKYSGAYDAVSASGCLEADQRETRGQPFQDERLPIACVRGNTLAECVCVDTANPPVFGSYREQGAASAVFCGPLSSISISPEYDSPDPAVNPYGPIRIDLDFDRNASVIKGVEDANTTVEKARWHHCKF